MEYEAKFQLLHLAEIRKRILALGSRLIQERMLERNLRFDDPERSLTASRQVLRLRQDRVVTLTYKRAMDQFEHRVELELEVGDFHQARSFLEALGYAVIHEYEKYRETFKLGSCALMLDELPFGCFVEIEDVSIEAVEENARLLGFDWDHRIQTGYLNIFEELRRTFDLQFGDAIFDHFEQLDLSMRERIATALTEYHSHPG